MRQLNPAALAAKDIRKVLKKEFPLVKFSVTSHTYNGGNSVDVKYANGPTREAVDNHIGHFKEGHFDGMIDMYEMSNRRDDIPQTKYLFVDRQIDEEIFVELFKTEGKKYASMENCFSINCWMYDLRCSVREFFARDLCKIDLTNGLPKA